MASFEERVKAAWEAWGQSIGYSKGGVAIALRAADAAEPEIGAVRRWLAGEAVDAATLPERLRETVEWLKDLEAKRVETHAALTSIEVDLDSHSPTLADTSSPTPKQIALTCTEVLRVLAAERDAARERLAAERDENQELMDALGQIANLFGHEEVEDAGTLDDLVGEVREALSERDECSPRIAALLATDEPVTADPTAPRFSAEVGSRAVPEALTREVREGAVAAVIHRSRGVQTAEQTAREVVRADQPPLRPLPPLDQHDHACPINPPASVCPTCAGVAQERVAELVTEFDTERSERRAVERQRDEARAEVERLKTAMGHVAAHLGIGAGWAADDVVAAAHDATDECDVLAAKVREYERCVGDCGRPCGLLPDHRFDCDCAESDCLDVRDAHYAAESAPALADAAAKGETVDEATLPERLREVLSERDEARVRLEHSTDWYQQRFNRLRRWVNEEVRPLSSEVATRYFAICANGSPAPHESADWSGTMHALKLANECGVRDLAAARAEVERLKRELDEERAWMREEKRHNIRMRAALDEIAVCLGRDGDDLKVLVEDVQRCSDGVVAADEKIERLKQERDALAAKVRDARYAADAVAKEEPPERVPTPEEAVVLTSAYDLDIGCDNGQDGDGDVFVAVVRRSDAVCVGEWRGEALLNALLSDIDPEDVARFAGAPTASPPPLDVEFTPERVPTPEEAAVLRAVDDGGPWAMKSPEAGECAKAGWIGNGHDGPGLTPSGCAALARFEAQEAAREKAAKFPQHCEYCDHVPGCGPRDGCDCAVCCHDPTPDDGGDVIDWRARALAAEAEVAKLRAALDDARSVAALLADMAPKTTDHGCHECVPGGPLARGDFVCNRHKALAWHDHARRAEAMGGSDADA